MAANSRGGESERGDDVAARVRVRDTAKSTFRGKTLTVLRVERGYAGKRSYLCEMPGFSKPGWFREEEVERVEA